LDKYKDRPLLKETSLGDRSIWSLFFLTCFLALLCNTAFPAPTRLKVAILPFKNFSEYPGIFEAKLLPEIINCLKVAGYEIVPYKDTYNFLLTHRLRAVGSVSRATARRIGKIFGAHFILVGTINFFQEESDNPVFGLSMRFVQAGDGNIYWAKDISFSGEDFAGLLGLGKVSKMERLLARIFRSDLPIIPQVSSPPPLQPLPPFELDRLVFNKYSRGKERVNTFVSFIPIDAEPSLVKVIFRDKEIKMKKDEEGIFSAEIVTPQAEGFYPFFFHCYLGKERWAIIPGEGIWIDNQPPDIELSLQAPFISPNGDGILDYATFNIIDKSPGPIREWKFIITDIHKKPLLSHHQRGVPPDQFFWRGIDEEGMPLADGNYYVQMQAQDLAGNQGESQFLSLSLDTKNPELTLEGTIEESLGVRNITFRITCKDQSPIKDWSIELLDREGKSLGYQDGIGLPPPQIKWEKIPLEVKEVSYILKVIDMAGNKGSLSGKMNLEKTEEKRPPRPEEVEFD
jgi:TolB-like protein